MNLLNLYVNGNMLILGSHPMTTSGSVNFDTCAFNFNHEWKGFNRTAVFAVADAVCYAVELDDTGICKIPKECLKKTGMLKIGVVGENDDGVIISTNVIVQRIVEGANNCELDSLPVDPETGENDNVVSNESAIHLLWQDNSFNLEPDFILDDYLDVDETDIHAYYNVVFSKLAERYPTYVTANLEGQDYSGNDIMSYTFAGENYDRTILITANHFASDNVALCALGGFFKNLCENYKKDANLNFLHEKVKFVVMPVVSPEAFLRKSRHNLNEVAPFVNYDHAFYDSPIEDKGYEPFSEPETIPVLVAMDLLSQENCVWYLDFECDKADYRGKKIYYKSNDIMQGNVIKEITSKFDSDYDISDPFSATHIVETNAPIATNYATNIYSLNACTVVWSTSSLVSNSLEDATLKYIRYMGNFILEAAKKCINAENPEPKPLLKHILWRSTGDTDKITLDRTSKPMWVSGYKQRFYGVYNIALNGHIKVSAQEPSIIRIKPIVYQDNSVVDDYDSRFNSGYFDVETEIPEGVSVIPFSCVFGGKYSNLAGNNISADIGTVIAAACPQGATVTEIAYTINAVPSDAKDSVEVLTPIGLASDFVDKNNLPSFNIVYPEIYYDII